MNKAVFSDWDKTLTRAFSSHEFMQHCADKKLIGREYAESIRITTARLKAGRISYLKSLEWFKKAIKGFQGVDFEAARQEAREFAKEFYEAGNVHEFAPALVREAKDKGYSFVVVTGSLGFLAEELCRLVGITEVLGTKEMVRAGRITGFDERILSPEGKAQAVKDYVQLHNLDLAGSIGLGDTSHDADFMALCGKAIAFEPNEDLRVVAVKKHWPMADEETILTALNKYL